MKDSITCINGHRIFANILCLQSFPCKVVIENRDSNSIFIIFYLNPTISFSCLKAWVDVSWVGAYLCFFSASKKSNK